MSSRLKEVKASIVEKQARRDEVGIFYRGLEKTGLVNSVR